MSSSRSIAAARSRRAGESAPPVSGNRPGTSINSHAAFVPQQPQPQYQQYQQMPSNVRLSKNQGPLPPPPPQIPSNGLPFSKLSVSDAIGLITLRLGRVEQYMMDIENNEYEGQPDGSINIPDNAKLVDNSVLTSLMNRLDSVEKRETSGVSNENSNTIQQEILLIKESIYQLNEEVNKTTLVTTQNKEQLFNLEKDLMETKDLYAALYSKFDYFINETNNKFMDYEYAIADLEKNIPSLNLIETTELVSEDNDGEASKSNILSLDLKSIIKQELSSESV